jgi:acetyl esterase/lipase
VQNELAPCLDWKRMKFFIDNIVPKDDAQRQSIESRPRFFASPMDGDLRGVCRTFVATAEFDLVRDEGEAYAQRLWNAGVCVTVRRYTGVPHLFPYLLNVRKARMYLDDVCAALREAHCC